MRLRLVERFISHRLHTDAWVNLVLLTYLLTENLFRVAEQLVSKSRDIVSASCVKDDDGKNCG